MDKSDDVCYLAYTIHAGYVVCYAYTERGGIPDGIVRASVFILLLLGYDGIMERA